MRATIYMVGVFLILSTQVVSVGCGDAESPIVCDEDSCRCMDRNTCDLDCKEIVGCQPSCSAVGDACRATCTAEDCAFGCHGAESCAGLCGDNCTTSCSSVDICSAETGANSTFTCTNAGNCAAELGADSRAICTNVDNCSIRCLGTCTVACILVAESCLLECPEGVERTNCGQGLFTCGIDCP